MSYLSNSNCNSHNYEVQTATVCHFSVEYHWLNTFSPAAVQVKIQGQNKEMLATACQMFMGKSEAEIAQIALETLEGHQRAIIAHLTVEVCADMAEGNWYLQLI